MSALGIGKGPKKINRIGQWNDYKWGRPNEMI